MSVVKLNQMSSQPLDIQRSKQETWKSLACGHEFKSHNPQRVIYAQGIQLNLQGKSKEIGEEDPKNVDVTECLKYHMK